MSNKQQYFPKHQEVFQPSSVEVVSGDRRSSESLILSLDGVEMGLDRRNPLAGAFILDNGVDQAIEDIKGGRAFLVDDQIVDFRPASRMKFVQDEAAIKKMVETVGMSMTSGGNIKLSRVTDQFDYDIGDGEGHQFNVGVGFSWSPFSTDISTFTDLIRFICDNTMAVEDESMSFKIPLINQWEENLSVANQAMSHNFNRVVAPRMAELPNERISLFDARTLVNIAKQMAEAAKSQPVNFNFGAIEKKLGMVTANGTPVNQAAAKCIQVPVSAFDAWNIATEMFTHGRSAKNGGAKAQGFANSLVFDAERRKRSMSLSLDSLSKDDGTFLNDDTAFFGVTSH